MYRLFVLIPTLLILCPTPTLGIDLTKIERTIRKEPTYQSKSPKYCLLVFGPEAKTRVWLVLNGDVLYADRNGNGDLTEEGERVESTGTAGHGGRQFHVPGIMETGSKVEHTLRVTAPKAQDQTCDLELVVTLGDHRTQFSDNELRCGDRPDTAPIVHFNGPLTLRLGDDQVFVRGSKPKDLRVEIGTPGLGKGTFAALAHRHGESPVYVDLPSSPSRVVGTEKMNGVPPAFHPLAEIEFPAKEADGPPIRAKFPLTWRC